MKTPEHSKAAISVALAAAIFSLPGAPAIAGSKDDPLLTKVMIDQFEVRDADADDPVVVDAQGFIGKDLNKLWWKVEAERVDGNTEEAEVQVLYSKAISSFWDVQLGGRRDFEPSPSRNWAVIGVHGLAPYFFEVDAALFAGESGRTALRLEVEYELLFTQQWILTPEIEVNLYGKDDAATGKGSGLSDVELGLRLRYEFRREFAPYIGISWTKQYGDSADFARADGDQVSETQVVLGVRMWF